MKEKEWKERKNNAFNWLWSLCLPSSPTAMHQNSTYNPLQPKCCSKYWITLVVGHSIWRWIWSGFGIVIDLFWRLALKKTYLLLFSLNNLSKNMKMHNNCNLSRYKFFIQINSFALGTLVWHSDITNLRWITLCKLDTTFQFLVFNCYRIVRHKGVWKTHLYAQNTTVNQAI